MEKMLFYQASILVNYHF